MNANKYLHYLQQEIHTVIMATLDGDGLPVTCAIDIMDCDDSGLYFLTAKGKGFYSRLKKNEYVALTGMKGEDTMSRVAVSIRGKAVELGPELLPRLFEKNPYMNEIYPDAPSRTALTVFRIYEGTGEWFDLSKKPIERADFAFGGAAEGRRGYFITEGCTGCGLCLGKCPMKCIDLSVRPAEIRQENCVRCGNCLEACPAGAVVKL